MAKNVKGLYNKYFQKSRVFLYPLIVDKNNLNGVRPEKTFLTWQGKYKIEDCKLCAVFSDIASKEFKKFESENLINNPNFEDVFHHPSGNKSIYVFNLSKYKEDYNMVVKGRYSLISDKSKSAIKNHYGVHSSEYQFVRMYIYPEAYYDEYAEMLTVNDRDIPDMIKLLRNVGELCDLPNFDKENLKLKVTDNSSVVK